MYRFQVRRCHCHRFEKEVEKVAMDLAFEICDLACKLLRYRCYCFFVELVSPSLLRITYPTLVTALSHHQS